VWDFIPLSHSRNSASFTQHPHLTLSLHDDHVGVRISFPHGAKSEYRQRIRDLGSERFVDVTKSVSHNLRKIVRRVKGAIPRIYIIQRHYRTQRSAPVTDASLDFDLRTIAPMGRGRVKVQQEWVHALYAVLSRKRSNLQMGIGINLPYGDRRVRSKEAIDLIAESWIACKPFLDAILRDAAR
jgi:hypothetical protein